MKISFKLNKKNKNIFRDMFGEVTKGQYNKRLWWSLPRRMNFISFVLLKEGDKEKFFGV